MTKDDFREQETPDRRTAETTNQQLLADGGTETELDETHDCGTNLLRIDEDDPENTHGADVVACPACLEIVRTEGSA
ncbi:hypothetical protein DU500_09005 [Haloplanus rubicundus]|uniref:Uncharacterized protein n=1 Tax=Haloplanus rubicundus TaxID=1547898 RepID=A0A345E2X9_9EURY|nr:hypothetical protein [Haloplanus rubicundus]AXG06551.1 hypothetical protein DU500_09005 [Haloplanus rubicundus]